MKFVMLIQKIIQYLIQNTILAELELTIFIIYRIKQNILMILLYVGLKIMNGMTQEKEKFSNLIGYMLLEKLRINFMLEIVK